MNHYIRKLLKKKNKFVVYKEIIDLLLKIQKIKPDSKIKNVTKGRHLIDNYSNYYLFKESNLFFDWYLPLFLKKKKCLNIKKRAKKVLLRLYNSLNFSNSCFVHRDFHLENLMKVKKNIGVIDSQDALIGNPAYDLVSIIDDVRIKTTLKLKKKIYNYYLKKNLKITSKNQSEFLEDFNILSIQRNLKIIGIFSRLYKRDNKKKYLKYIPYTWKLIEGRMHSKTFLNLKKILDDNIPKKIRKKIFIK